jgi:hypothetical protein
METQPMEITMLIVLTKEDIITLSPSARAELMAASFPKAHFNSTDFPPGFDADDFEDVVELTPGQVEEFIEGCSEQTVAGLKVIAEHGPAIHASLLDEVGIENYAHFQGRVTKRTRTVTKDKDAFLFGWDDWSEQPSGVGHYAVTQATFRSLRIYFELD